MGDLEAEAYAVACMCTMQAILEVGSGPCVRAWCRQQEACAVGDLEVEAYVAACMCMMQVTLEVGSGPRAHARCRRQEVCAVWVEGGVANTVRRQRR